MSGTGTTNSSSPTISQESSEFRPSRTVVAINALWFLSLSLSVAVSLIAMLAKEWCHSFMSGRSGETHERARLRQKRWNEIERLKMIDVLTLLPLLIHLALLLFAVGLCVYLWDLNIFVAIPVIVITSISTLIYASTVLHSLTAEHCPYTTGSSKLAKSYIKAWLSSPSSSIHNQVRLSAARLGKWIVVVSNSAKHLFSKYGKVKTCSSIPKWVPRLEIPQWTTKSIAYISRWTSKIPTLSTALSYRRANLGQSLDPEQPIAHSQEMDILASQMLSWLLVNCPDSNTTDLVVYSLAGAEPWLPRLPLLESSALDTVFQSLDKCFEHKYFGYSYLRLDASPDVASLCLRALQFLLQYYNGEGFLLHTEPNDVMKGTWSEDFYHRRHSEMSSRIESAGYIFRIGWPPSPHDIGAFSDTFSLEFASERDSLPGYQELYPHKLIKAIEAHLGHDIVLHPATLIAIVRQMTNRLCEPRDRWVGGRGGTASYTLCFLLLRLYLHSERHNGHQDLQFHIAVAIAATVLNSGSFPGWTHPPERIPLLTRAMELTAYHNPPKQFAHRGQRRSLRYSRDLEKPSLLALGLLGLLEGSSPQQLSAPGNLETCAAVFESQNIAVEYSYIYSIPSTFTFGMHAARIVAQRLSNGIQPDNGITTNNANWLRCLLAICNWTLIIRDDEVDHHRAVHSALLSWLCTVVSPEQQRYCTVLLDKSSFGCTQSCLESLPSDMLTRLLVISLSGNKFIAPTAMRELWDLTNLMLELSDNSPVVRSQLHTVKSSTKTSVPRNLGELGLLQQWFPHLQRMCIEAPQELLGSDLLNKLQYSYWFRHSEDVVVWPFSGPGGPETISGGRVYEILVELEEQCRSAVALNKQLWHELPFDESTEEAHD
ncbi:hypothetical protein FRC12_001339 [Ceratobasidium sp. 428]|nr:hypothetical protein FRC12_001339 [Ceratobasidium sp. 428]